ncbi:unnamed protein product [Amaranthus hypochondriacus]
MPRNRFAKVDVIIDTGNPLLDRTIDGFLKISTVAATRAAAEDAYHIAKTGTISTRNFEESLKRMCKEGAYWGKCKLYFYGNSSLLEQDPNLPHVEGLRSAAMRV